MKIRSVIEIEYILKGKNLQKRSKFTKMILPCEIPQLEIPDVGRNHVP